MKNFHDYICPIALIIGTVCLIYLVVYPTFNYENGWYVTVFASFVWSYGYAFHADIIPFIKRMIEKSSKKAET